jgi:hypothetical protein
MSSLPRDVYEHVRDLALVIVNAMQAGDDELCEAQMFALRNYYNEQTALGFSHPFLTEAVADYTENAAEAIALYELALEQARACPGEPVHTKMIALAARQIELARFEQAEAFLRDGRTEAVCSGDLDSTSEATELARLLDDQN